MPATWLAGLLADSKANQHYREKHELGNLPADLQDFDHFYQARSERLRTKLTGMLTPSS